MTKKPRFRPTLGQYNVLQLVANGLLERLTIERKNHQETYRIAMYYLAGMLILVWAPIIIQAVYGV